jgi:hypothetical protein
MAMRIEQQACQMASLEFDRNHAGFGLEAS